MGVKTFHTGLSNSHVGLWLECAGRHHQNPLESTKDYYHSSTLQAQFASAAVMVLAAWMKHGLYNFFNFVLFYLTIFIKDML